MKKTTRLILFLPILYIAIWLIDLGYIYQVNNQLYICGFFIKKMCLNSESLYHFGLFFLVILIPLSLWGVTLDD